MDFYKSGIIVKISTKYPLVTYVGRQDNSFKAVFNYLDQSSYTLTRFQF